MSVHVNTQGLSPMMKQYFTIKDKHKDHILFFRLGDFYEMFFDDALFASKQLGLTLTARDCGLSERAPMCGVPHHSAEGYIAKLIKNGYKVAICDQVEDPSVAKGVVKREVVRVITPGTILEEHLLEEGSNNYLCSIYLDLIGYGLAFADISTGEVNLVQLESTEDVSVINELTRYNPSEIIFNSAFLNKKSIAKYMKERLQCTADLIDESHFILDNARNSVISHFGNEVIKNIDIELKPRCISALGGLLAYLYDTQMIGTERLITINLLEETKFMNLDMNTRANLELIQTLKNKDRKGSLLWVLDDTKTSMGKRLLKTYINQPLINQIEIDKRLNAVEELFKNESLNDNISVNLSGIFDMERLITRIVYGSATPREYKILEAAILNLPELKAILSTVKSKYLTAIFKEIDTLEDVALLLKASIITEPPNSIKDGGVICDGFNDELDQFRNLIKNSRQMLSELEEREREKTGIKNLKIIYSKIFGYCLEVTRSYINLVPDYFIRKQTLAGCERYIIEELKNLETNILSANENAVKVELNIFEKIRVEITRKLHRIQKTSYAIAKLDVYSSFARISIKNRYIRPLMEISDVIDIKEGRHPVIELLLSGSAPFVPNDTFLSSCDNQIAIITGPNMAGKSTYMRQTAVIVLMAQLGCFVPASYAKIGVVDGIFTRIGASDDLTAGQSTFMVEMVEVAQILNSATKHSLLILDEIGRGTSTYDGMSIARAVIEYISDKKKLGAKTMFATHYHELTEMESQFLCIKNYNIACKKRGDELIFLRKIVHGGADESYGIEVSKLAGIPDWIIKRAREILNCMENKEHKKSEKVYVNKKEKESSIENIQLSISNISEVEKILQDLDLNTLTPIEALTLLYKLKEKAKVLV